MSEGINNDNARIKAYVANIESTLNSIEKILESHCPVLNGEKYISDSELSKALNVSKRALHDYRTQGKLPYYYFGGKILYREEDIVSVLNENRRERWSVNKEL